MSPSTPLHIPRTDEHLLPNNYAAARVESLLDRAQTSLRDISNTSQLDDQPLPFQQPAAGPHTNTFNDARLSSPRVAADDPFKDLLTLPRSSTPIVPAHTWSTTPLSTFGDGPSDVGFLPRDREPGSHAARHPERQVNQPRNQKKKPKKSAGEDGDRDLMGQLKGDSDASKVKERLQSLRDVVEDELVAIASDFKQDLAKLRTQLMTGFVKPKGTSRTPSLYNAKMKEARKDTEVQDQLDKLGLTGRERQSWMQNHVRQQLASISPEEELELKDACLKDRETASIGVRVNYKATCTDFTKNIERISTEVRFSSITYTLLTTTCRLTRFISVQVQPSSASPQKRIRAIMVAPNSSRHLTSTTSLLKKLARQPQNLLMRCSSMSSSLLIVSLL